MRDNEIRARRAKKFKATANSRHNEPVAENLLDRAFTVREVDKVWVSDITYVWADEGWPVPGYLPRSILQDGRGLVDE